MTAKYEHIATVTLDSPASSVIFSSIPQGYRDLELVINAGNDGNTFGGLRYNSDSGTNYSYILARGDGNNTAPGSSTSLNYAVALGVSIGSGGTLDQQAIVSIQDYSATDKHKTSVSRANDASQSAEMMAARWANTNAITSIEFFTFGASSAIAGSTFDLYGIVGGA